jgi:hypothetical protein
LDHGVRLCDDPNAWLAERRKENPAAADDDVSRLRSSQIDCSSIRLTGGDRRKTALAAPTKDLTNLTSAAFIKWPETGAVDYVSFR